MPTMRATLTLSADEFVEILGEYAQARGFMPLEHEFVVADGSLESVQFHVRPMTPAEHAAFGEEPARPEDDLLARQEEHAVRVEDALVRVVDQLREVASRVDAVDEVVKGLDSSYREQPSAPPAPTFQKGAQAAAAPVPPPAEQLETEVVDVEDVAEAKTSFSVRDILAGRTPEDVAEAVVQEVPAQIAPQEAARLMASRTTTNTADIQQRIKVKTDPRVIAADEATYKDPYAHIPEDEFVEM